MAFVCEFAIDNSRLGFLIGELWLGDVSLDNLILVNAACECSLDTVCSGRLFGTFIWEARLGKCLLEGIAWASPLVNFRLDDVVWEKNVGAIRLDAFDWERSLESSRLDISVCIVCLDKFAWDLSLDNFRF